MERIAGILAELVAVDAAVTLVRPLAEAEVNASPWYGLAALLAQRGYIGEVLTVLRSGLADWFLARALVEVTAGLGRDDEVAESRRPFADAGDQMFEGFLATVLRGRAALDKLQVRTGTSH